MKRSLLSSVRRLADDVTGSWSAMPPAQALGWYGRILSEFPAILRQRLLIPADLKMAGEKRFRYFGQDFVFSVDDINSTEGSGYTMLRELFARGIYFRAFRNPRFDLSVDAGCNIGVVSSILRQLAGPAGRVVAIDLHDYPQNLFRRKLEAGGQIEFTQALLCAPSLIADRERLAGLCRELNCAPDMASTLDELLTTRGIDKVDFLKMDIEGAEFEIFADSADWLRKVDAIAMEVHPECGNPGIVADRLREQGFDVTWCDSFGYPSAVEAAGFMYGSRTEEVRVLHR